MGGGAHSSERKTLTFFMDRGELDFLNIFFATQYTRALILNSKHLHLVTVNVYSCFNL